MNRKEYRQGKRTETKEKMHERLSEIAEEQRKRARFKGKINVEVRRKNPRLEAHTHMITGESVVGYSKEYAKEQGSRVYAFVRDASAHEINHHGYLGVHRGHEFRGCERNVDLGTKLVFEPVYEVLSAKGFSTRDAEYEENIIADTILHVDLSPVFDLKGIGYFFEEVGRTSPNGKFTSYYEAHIRLHEALCGSKPEMKRMQKHFSTNKKTNKKIAGCLEKFFKESGLAELGASFDVCRNPRVLEERLAIREYLNNEKNWPRVSRAHAEAFSELMEQRYAMPIFEDSGAGTKGREKEDSSKEGSEFQKQRKGRGYKMGRVGEAHDAGTKAPSWIESYEALSLLYEHLAKRLEIETRTITENDSMPILFYGSEALRAGDSLRNICFGFDRRGEVELRKKPYTVDIQVPVKESTLGFPKAKFVYFDTSGSMFKDFNNRNEIGNTLNIPWGDRSKYHGACVELWGFVRWLEETHLLEKTGIDLHNFSTKTIVGRGLDEALKVALRPQKGATKLNLERIKEIFRDRGSFILGISDGMIENWGSLKEEFLKGVAENYCVHLQLGPETEASRDIREAGAHVENIWNPEELRGRSIILANKFYRSYGR